MPIGHGASAENVGTGNVTVQLNLASAARGAVVGVAHGEVSTDLVTGVTIGGVAMTRQVTVADTTGTEVHQKGRVYIYTLAADIAAGQRNVVVTRTGTAPVWVGVWTVTGNAVMEVLDTDSAAMANNPTLTLARSGRASLAYLVAWGSVNSPSAFTTPAGFTRGPDHDFGEHSAAIFREVTTSEAAANHTVVMAPTNNAVVGITVTESAVAPPAISGSDHLCGGECGIVGPDAFLSATGHWHIAGEALPTSQASRARHGGRALLFAPVDQTSYLGRTLPAAQTSRWERVYFYFDGALPDRSCTLWRAALAAGEAPNLAFQQSSGSIAGRFGQSNFATATPFKALVPNRWYRLEILVNVVANPNTIEVRICEASQADPQADGALVTLGTASLAQAATTITEFRIGAACWGASTGRVVVDDHLTGTGTANYPAGASTIVTGVPAADSTHSFNAAGDFRSASGNLPTNVVDAYARLTGLLTDASSYLEVGTAAMGEYLAIKLGGVPAMDSVRAMEVVSVHKGATETLHKQSLRWVNGVNVVDVVADADFSELQLVQSSKHYTTLPGGVTPTSTLLNATTFRFASSFTTAAVGGGQIAGLMVELDGIRTALPPQGPTSSEQNPSYEFPAAGTYPVTLTVTDNEGLTHSVTKEVTIFSDTVQTLDVQLSGSGSLGATLRNRHTLTAAFSGSGDLAAVFDEAPANVSSTLRVELREGGTLRVVRYLTPLNPVPGESTRWEMTLTAEEVATVTSWANVELWLVADAGTQPIRVRRFRLLSAA